MIELLTYPHVGCFVKRKEKKYYKIFLKKKSLGRNVPLKIKMLQILALFSRFELDDTLGPLCTSKGSYITHLSLIA